MRATLELGGAVLSLGAQRRAKAPTEQRSARGRRIIGAGQRMLEAGEVSRLTHSWVTWPTSIWSLIETHLRRVRARSREQAVNNDYLVAYLSAAEENIAGPQGITLQSEVLIPGTDKPDLEAQTAIERGFVEWGKRRNCDIAGLLSFRDICRLAVRSCVEDGEFLCRIIRSTDAGPWRFALQVLDPELLDVDHKKVLANGNHIRCGIEFNGYGKPIAYWLIDSKDQDVGAINASRKYIRYDAGEIIHVYLPIRAGQRRGLPWAMSALTRLRMLGLYEMAALVAARVGASKNPVITTDRTHTGIGQDEDGNEIETAEPGDPFVIRQGDTITTYDPTYPSGDFAPFNKGILRGISAGLRSAYHTLSRDLEGMSYSGGRLGELDEREVWQGGQMWLIDWLCVEVFERWLTQALLSQQLRDARGVPLDPARELEFRRASWQPRAWEWPDPYKDMLANVMAMEKGFKSWSQIVRETGRDPADVLREIVADQKAFKDAGIVLTGSEQSVAFAHAKDLALQDEKNKPRPEAVDDDEDAGNGDGNGNGRSRLRPADLELLGAGPRGVRHGS